VRDSGRTGGGEEREEGERREERGREERREGEERESLRCTGDVVSEEEGDNGE
jgi:hypothetical protein